MAAESTGGSFSIQSEPGVGTKVTAVFGLSHIDRMPLGERWNDLYLDHIQHTDRFFIYIYVQSASFTLDTREFKNILEGVPLNNPEVSEYIRQFLNENSHEVDGGAVV